jgi:hypothetical protein
MSDQAVRTSTPCERNTGAGTSSTSMRPSFMDCETCFTISPALARHDTASRRVYRHDPPPLNDSIV